MLTLTITPEAQDALLAHARSSLPNECVGVLLGGDAHVTRALPLVTTHPSATTFEAEPASLMRAQQDADAAGLQIIGYYHSHPAGAARPSARDRAQHLWADLPPYYHIIVSPAAESSERLGAFDMRCGAWRPLRLEVRGDT